MPRLSDLLLKNRRKRTGWVPEGSTDGLLDILSNVVGVMALVGSLTGVIAANSALEYPSADEQKEHPLVSSGAGVCQWFVGSTAGRHSHDGTGPRARRRSAPLPAIAAR